MRLNPLVLLVIGLGLACGAPQAELLLLPITVPDSGMADAGDGGPDAGPDAGQDAGRDAGPDAGPDGGPDAGRDAGPDGGPEAACNLGVSPPTLDFGKVIVGNSMTAALTLFNDGGATCHGVRVDLTGDSDPSFSLPDSQQSLEIAPGETASVLVMFTTSNAILPLFRTATMQLQTITGLEIGESVLLTANVAADCNKTSQVIYTFDASGNLSTFDPNTLTFTAIGFLSCQSFGGAGPFSMSVDENGIAWVLYFDGNLYQVDTGTGSCNATSYVADQQGFFIFGMGDVFRSPTNTDELFIASSFSFQDNLGTLDFATLDVTTVGPLAISGAELAGTGDGELWAFSPDPAGDGSQLPVLAQIDWSTGNVLQSQSLNGLPAMGFAWAMKYFGGSFWIFVDTQVFTVDRATLTLTQAIANTQQAAVVGAGVSTCATLQ